MKKYWKFESEEQTREFIGKIQVGDPVMAICTGIELEAVVVNTSENEHSFMVKVNHRPISWGDDSFTETTLSCRKIDGFGSMKWLAVETKELLEIGHTVRYAYGNNAIKNIVKVVTDVYEDGDVITRIVGSDTPHSLDQHQADFVIFKR